MEFAQNPYIVYVKTNEVGYITAINSSAFLADPSGWTQIDSGSGDRYHHSQGNYLPGPLITKDGAYRYKLVEGIPVECTPEEIAEQEAANHTEPVPSQEERIKALEGQNEMLVQCILEMSEIIYV